MAVKVVTDSTSDIPPQLAKDLGIAVVPIYTVFGDKSYRDKIDISEDEFYDRLINGPVHPTTSIPTPEDFARVYADLSRETDEIISIILTSKESGTYNSALLGKELVQAKCRIEVIDSRSLSMALGFLVIEAARKAQNGANLDELMQSVHLNVPKVHLLIKLDTLKYVVRGGRLPKAHGILGSVLKVKPLLALRDGDLSLMGVARTKDKAKERLYEFAKGFPIVKERAVVYTTAHDEAEELADRIKADFPGVPLRVTRVSSSLGTHAGPGGMGVAVLEG